MMMPNSVENSVSLWQREESPLLFIVKDKNCFQSCNDLKLYQFPSSHNDWGIYSQVWDGGLASLSYLLYCQQSFIREWRQEPFVLLDIGAGTGIVGIGAALWMIDDSAADARTSCTPIADNITAVRPNVLVTDIIEAVQLLTENCRLNDMNSDHSKSQNRGSCEAVAFEWEEDMNDDSRHTLYFFESISQKFSHVHRILIVGSDVIYRPSLFRPLLCSIRRIVRYFTQHGMEVRCIMGAQSLRTHLHQFYDLARGPDFGFRLDFLARVHVDSSPASTQDSGDMNMNVGTFTVHLPTAQDVIEADTDDQSLNFLPVDAVRGKGIVHIFELTL